ncbi:4Fe-4S dicluster domain-containing protein [Candidatus Woesearchaeota archaeon]|nr:4Fe-4S dicluster domain-containing protein [Candidatus Woesearchaeota archaeon]
MVKVNKERCKLCGICISFCPIKILDVKGKEIIQKPGSKCSKCRMCENYCPEMAIEVE